jgi:hypothetical protein
MLSVLQQPLLLSTLHACNHCAPPTGDDGAIALASSLSSNTQLHRLWLQHNAIGPPGATALATAMRHNTSCTSLKLLQGNEAVPRDVAQMAQKLAWHNRG